MEASHALKQNTHDVQASQASAPVSTGGTTSDRPELRARCELCLIGRVRGLYSTLYSVQCVSLRNSSLASSPDVRDASEPPSATESDVGSESADSDGLIVVVFASKDIAVASYLRIVLCM
jgi:hypothetical protein